MWLQNILPRLNIYKKLLLIYGSIIILIQSQPFLMLHYKTSYSMTFIVCIIIFSTTYFTYYYLLVSVKHNYHYISYLNNRVSIPWLHVSVLYDHHQVCKSCNTHFCLQLFVCFDSGMERINKKRISAYHIV
jgi:hypothetical protein